ncbi:PilC/PilY family type IV pilus protein [Cupriavidus basilensis]|uniref:PilC/PilY family type IV pilus protein n=1 Tax=Cupriavidus basilensis TaxID=68895 RepID=A0ABT6ALX8_9BURK|nr:PilC/PilY family type IV pilus protein [Cupriavidus basilensis]MDF3833598.1 PilC/PilY family type IV pilus protein [Cupriavidus basilensis]
MKLSTLLKVCLGISALAMISAYSASTDIAVTPLSATSQAAPNVIFGIDDSGSMDFEVLMNTSDGALWWDTGNKNFYSGGKFNFNDNGSAGNGWMKYAYLFPNGQSSSNDSDLRRYADSTSDHYAVPPLPQYSYMRSSDYNPLYYNPSVTYVPWPSAYIGGAMKSFSAASTAAVRSHPYYPTQTSSSPYVWNLAGTVAVQSNPGANTTFRMYPGMVIPLAWASANGLTQITYRKNGGSWGTININADLPVPSNVTYWDVSLPYRPATYYVKDATCTASTAGCIAMPDGGFVREWQITAANSQKFPSGRTYTDELQNFANWFQYYRKRKLMLASGMGQVLTNLKGMFGGYTNFNSGAGSAITMYDFSSTDNAKSGSALLGAIYQSVASGGTPTLETLNFIGSQFMRTDANAPVKYACQQNAGFILTDGYANKSTVAPPSYLSSSSLINSAPYTNIPKPSLADIASSYFVNNLRSDLTAGLVPVNTTDTSWNADKNPNLHMNTYAVALGAKGYIYGQNTAQANSPNLNPPTWVATSQNYSPNALDDLWHATINGRGQMFRATNAADLTSFFQQVLQSLLSKSASNAAIAVSSTNGGGAAFMASYNGQNWSGELTAAPIDPSTGFINAAAPLWKAREQLTGRSPGSRLIATYDGGKGVLFDSGTGGLQASTINLLNSPGKTDGPSVLAYLRGDRSLEGSTYRTRTSLLGDIVSAEPVYVAGAAAYYSDAGYAGFQRQLTSRKPAIYQGANDGMLHAFDASSGAELWAYVPGALLTANGKMNAYTITPYAHQYYVDATPAVGDVYLAGTKSWSTLLVGGLGAGGSGYYALDVTSSTAQKAADVASKVKWEFPNSATSNADAANLGLTFGKPVLAKTKAMGWVVLVPSGYNNNVTRNGTQGDGKGRLFVLDPATGNVIQSMSTGVGDTTTPSGLAYISAFAANGATDATIDYVYGGDLLGNVWRFDLSGASTSAWNVSKLASLVDGSGKAQPISSAPELTVYNGQRLVFVGTGLLLGQSDLSVSNVQSMYALVDTMTAVPLISNVRTTLVKRAVTLSGSVRHISNTPAIDFSKSPGWYFDLPGSGERVVTNPTAVAGILVFTTDIPSAATCGSSSYLYAVDLTTGGELPSTNFISSAMSPWTGIALSNTALSSRPSLVALSNGNLDALTQQSNATSSTSQLPINLLSKSKRVAWKEVYIQK